MMLRLLLVLLLLLLLLLLVALSRTLMDAAGTLALVNADEP